MDQLSDEQFSILSVLGDTPPKMLRNWLYDFVPENVGQMSKWKKGYLIAKVFDLYLQGNISADSIRRQESHPV